MSHINLIEYRLIVIDYIVVFETMTDLFRSFYLNQLPCDIINYFSFYKCFRSKQEHFNQLHCSWVVFNFWEEHVNRFKRSSNLLVHWNNQLHYRFNPLQAVTIIFSINSYLVFSSKYNEMNFWVSLNHMLILVKETREEKSLEIVTHNF